MRCSLLLLFLGTFLFHFSAPAAELEASDGAASDVFGLSVSLSGGIGFVGAYGDDIGGNTNQGSAYLFRGLDTATGSLTQNIKLTASDGRVGDSFGFSVSVSGSAGLVGAYQDDVGVPTNTNEGSTYLYRGLDTASGSITQHVKLTASDTAAGDQLGYSVSLSGSTGLVGALNDDIGSNSDQGSAYVFRGLDTASGNINENVKLTSSDGTPQDNFGRSVSLSGSIGLIGAHRDWIGSNSEQGSAYVFRGLDTASGNITQNVKLTASDGAASDWFGQSVSLSGTIGLVGAYLDNISSNSNQGSAYVFRGLDAASGSITQNVKLTASDGAADDWFGWSVSLSGSTGLVGAYGDDIGGNANQGSAYLFRRLDTATGSITQNVKLTASDGVASDEFGVSVSLDGDHFLIGANQGDGVVVNSGKAYSGSVSALTTLDAGSTSRIIDGISFISQDDWIIGENTDGNAVILTTGDSASVTAAGKAVYIGKNSGSDNNTLTVEGSLTANAIHVGGQGGLLHVDGTVTTTSGITVKDGAILSGGGTIDGTILLEDGATIAPGNSPGILNTGSQTWSGGGTYIWDVNAKPGSGVAGTNWDHIGITGDLTLTATSLHPFVIDINGTISDLVDLIQYDWTIASASAGISGFSADRFQFDASGFTSNTGGTFSILQQGNDLVLRYASAPEPSRALLMMTGLCAMLLRRRRG